MIKFYLFGCAALLSASAMADSFVPSAPVELKADVYGTKVTLSWSRSDAGAVISGTDFEGDKFLPEGWRVKNGYNYNPNVTGNWEHWKGGAERPMLVHSGECSALLRASGDGSDSDESTWSQDEWLIMNPGIGAVYMDFWYYLHPNVLDYIDAPWELDHYYVKISRDNGKTWRVIWDGRYDMDDQLEMRQAVLFLGEPSDANTLVAFNGVSRDTFKNMWAVDDIEFRAAASKSEMPGLITRADDCNGDIVYRIYLDGELLKDNLKSLYYVDSSEKSLTKHTYKVCAYNSVTKEDYAAATIDVSFADEFACNPVTNLEAVNDPDEEYDNYWYVWASWDAPEGDRVPDYYEVTMNGAVIAQVYSDDIYLKAGNRFLQKGAYKLGVTAFYSSPEGQSETLYAYTFPGTKATPRDLKGEYKDGNVELNWDFSEGEGKTGFKVYRGDELLADNVTDNSYVDNNVADGMYQYSVHAVYSDGETSLPDIADVIVNKAARVDGVNESFSEGHLPSNWERILEDDGELNVMYTYGWRFDNWFGSDFSSVPQLSGKFASIDGEESGWFALDAYLITPEVEMPAGFYPSISFTKAFIDDAELKALYNLLVSTDGGENWDLIAELNDLDTYPNGNQKFELTDYEGKNVKVGWYYHSFMNGRAALDNVKVEAVNLAGVESVASEVSTIFDIYNMAGVKIFGGVEKSAIESLPAGVYIVKGNTGDVKKIVKK